MSTGAGFPPSAPSQRLYFGEEERQSSLPTGWKSIRGKGSGQEVGKQETVTGLFGDVYLQETTAPGGIRLRSTGFRLPFSLGRRSSAQQQEEG